METQVIPLIGNFTVREPGASTWSAARGQVFVNHDFQTFENTYTGQKSMMSLRRPAINGSFATPSGYASLHKIWPWWNYNAGASTYVAAGLDSVTGFAKFIVAGNSYEFTFPSGTNKIKSISDTRASGGTDAILIGRDGTDYYIYPRGGAATQISVPSNSIGGMVTVKGYTFIANKDGKIYNSTLNDPTAGYVDFISAEMFPDGLKELFRWNDYLFALGQASIEGFAITGNATGSPLRYVPEFHAKVGIASATADTRSFCYGNDTVYWSAAGPDVSPGMIYMLDGSGRAKKLPHSNYMDKFIMEVGDAGAHLEFAVLGNKRYVLSPGASFDGVNYTLVYDIDLEFWHLWKGATGVNPVWGSVGINPSATDGGMLIIYDTDKIGNILPSNISTANYMDVGVNFQRQIISGRVNFGSNKRKIINYIKLIGDQATSSSVVSISWSDDDGQTFNTPRSIDLSSPDPVIWACGQTRNRIFKIEDSLAGDFRYEALEIGYTLCDS